jgi:hypothetical protein
MKALSTIGTKYVFGAPKPEGAAEEKPAEAKEEAK